jgi:hypothetical protein
MDQFLGGPDTPLIGSRRRPPGFRGLTPTIDVARRGPISRSRGKATNRPSGRFARPLTEMMAMTFGTFRSELIRTENRVNSKNCVSLEQGFAGQVGQIGKD